VAQALGDLAATVVETEWEQRKLHEYLDCVRLGLNGGPDPKVPGGVRAATPQADAKLAGDLLTEIDPFVRGTEPNSSRYRDKPDELAAAAAALAEKLRGLVPAPKAKAAMTDSKTAEPKTVDPDPAKAKPAKAEPAKGEPAKGEPAKGEPAKVEPAKAEPAKAEPAKAP
jgi:hypothetical protein